MTSTVAIDLEDVPLRTSLKLILNQLDLTYDGQGRPADDHVEGVSSIRTRRRREPTGASPAMAGMGGMGGMAAAWAYRWSRRRRPAARCSTRRRRASRPRSCGSRTGGARCDTGREGRPRA